MKRAFERIPKAAYAVLCLILALLCAILIWKGGYVQRFFGRDEPYDYRSNAQYERKVTVFDALSYPEDVDILMLGDSLTDDADWNSLFPGYVVVNQGISGDTTEGLLNRLSDAIKCAPKNIFICIGFNDLWKGIPTDDIVQNYGDIFSTLAGALPGANIYIAQVLNADKDNRAHVTNARVAELNARLHALPLPENARFITVEGVVADKPGVHTSDGLHLTGATYIMIAEQLKRYL